MSTTVYDTLPPEPRWDDDGHTIDFALADEIVSAVLDDHGVEIDWSTNDTGEQVGRQVGVGESVSQDEIWHLMRVTAHAAIEAAREELELKSTPFGHYLIDRRHGGTSVTHVACESQR